MKQSRVSRLRFGVGTGVFVLATLFGGGVLFGTKDAGATTYVELRLGTDTGASYDKAAQGSDNNVDGDATVSGLIGGQVFHPSAGAGAKHYWVPVQVALSAGVNKYELSVTAAEAPASEPTRDMTKLIDSSSSNFIASIAQNRTLAAIDSGRWGARLVPTTGFDVINNDSFWNTASSQVFMPIVAKGAASNNLTTGVVEINTAAATNVNYLLDFGANVGSETTKGDYKSTVLVSVVAWPN